MMGSVFPFLFRYNTGLDLGFLHLGTQYVLCSFPCWLLRPLIPLSRSQISRVPGPHWAVNGEHHTLAWGSRRPDFSAWSGSLLLLPLLSGKTLKVSRASRSLPYPLALKWLGSHTASRSGLISCSSSIDCCCFGSCSNYRFCRGLAFTSVVLDYKVVSYYR